MKRLFFIVLILCSDICDGQISSARKLLLSQSGAFSLSFEDDYTTTSTQTTPDFINIGSSGLKLYLTDGSDITYQYSMSPAGDLSTSSYDSKNHNPSIVSNPPLCMRIGDSGSKYYIADRIDSIVYQFNMSVSYDISTSSSSGNTFELNRKGSRFSFNSDGTKLIVLYAIDNEFDYYNLSTGWDISTASFSSTVSSPLAASLAFTFSDDGLKLYISNEFKVIYEYNLSTGWDISTAVLQNGSADVSDRLVSNLNDMYFYNDDIYFSDNIPDKIVRYSIVH